MGSTIQTAKGPEKTNTEGNFVIRPPNHIELEPVLNTETSRPFGFGTLEYTPAAPSADDQTLQWFPSHCESEINFYFHCLLSHPPCVLYEKLPSTFHCDSANVGSIHSCLYKHSSQPERRAVC